MTKTFSNRSNAKRAIAAFRDKHPDLVDVGLALVPTGARGASGDAQTIEATGVLTKYATDAIEAAGFIMKADAVDPADLPTPPAKALRATKRQEAREAKAASRKEVAKAKEERKAKPKPEAKPKAENTERAPRAKKEGTKTDLVIGLLRRKNGATVQNIMDATGWLPHTTRAFISATIGKKLGHTIETEKSDHGRIYRIAA